MATKLSISKEKTAELIKEFGKSDNDSGSAEVQVAILSERIRNLTEHLKSHKKDNHTRRGLMKLIGKRRGLLKHIKERNIEEYRALINKLGTWARMLRVPCYMQGGRASHPASALVEAGECEYPAAEEAQAQ